MTCRPTTTVFSPSSISLRCQQQSCVLGVVNLFKAFLARDAKQMAASGQMATLLGYGS